MSYLIKNYNYLVNNDTVFSNQEINSIQEYAKTLEHQPGQVVVYDDAGVQDIGTAKDIRDSEVRWIHPNENTGWLWNKLNHIITDVNNNCFHMDIGTCSALQHTTYQTPSGFYGSHVDCAVNSYPQRKISFTLQLSDENDYEGGDLLIYYESIKNPFKAPRKKGCLTFFHSLYLHEVTPVTLGTRCALVGWISGPPLK